MVSLCRPWRHLWPTALGTITSPCSKARFSFRSTPVTFQQTAPKRPDPPDDCCNDGCPRCVWDVYYKELEEYEKQSNRKGGKAIIPKLMDAYRRFSAPTIESVQDFYHKRNIVKASVIGAEMVNASTEAPAVEVTLSLPDVSDYDIGGHILVHAPNPSHLVMPIVKRLGYTPDSIIEIKRMDVPQAKALEWLPNTFVTLQHLLTRYTDLTSLSVLRSRTLLQVLMEATSDNAERLALEGYWKDPSTIPPHLTSSLLALLEGHPSCRPRLETVLQCLRPLTPRTFSICSSPLVSSNEIRFMFSLAGTLAMEGCLEDYPDYAGLTSDSYGGLATSWLYTQVYLLHAAQQGKWPLKMSIPIGKPKDKDKVYTLPADPSQPIIMFAAGSGISPLVAMLRQREAIAKQAGGPTSPCILYYGCRNQSHMPYSESLEHFLESGVLSAVDVTFSRSAGTDSATISNDWIVDTNFKYVWQLVAKHADELKALMAHNGVVYVCGPQAMKEDTKKAFASIVGEESVELWMDASRYRTEEW